VPAPRAWRRSLRTDRWIARLSGEARPGEQHGHADADRPGIAAYLCERTWREVGRLLGGEVRERAAVMLAVKPLQENKVSGGVSETDKEPVTKIEKMYKLFRKAPKPL